MTLAKANGQMTILNPGVLALIQDLGRIGKHRIGLTTGGPMDPFAFRWANRICSNDDNATAIEISVGGFSAEFNQKTQIVMTGATTDIKINGQIAPMWQTITVQAGDVLKMGFAKEGCRIYLAIQGGFQVEPQFDSTSTVVREAIGGLDGKALAKGTAIPYIVSQQKPALMMRFANRPNYSKPMPMRVVLGYQQASFSRVDKAHFFSSEYTVSERIDRMGYRLLGPECRSSISKMLSEGISHGAIQLPPDGQPIVLLNDRQTIGGYPKIGAMMARDTGRLSQMVQGQKVRFDAVTIEEAHAINLLAQRKEDSIKLINID